MPIAMMLLCVALLVLQGIPVRPSEGGAITGVIRTATGQPAIGVRVTALSRPDSPNDALDGAAMAAVAQTDATGRYRLENVAPGQYYVSSGRLDLPTFYPGTLEMLLGTPLRITPGLLVSDIDFAIADSSFRVAGTSGGTSSIAISLQVSVEGDSPVPVFSPAGFVLLSLSDIGSNQQFGTSLMSASVSLPVPSVAKESIEYEVRALNLPVGYSVKSMRLGSVDLTKDRLRVTSADMPFPATGPASTLRMVNIDNGASAMTVAPGAQSTKPIEVVLAKSPVAVPPGARVSGRLPDTQVRAVSISGIAGTLYADGRFEFAGIQPGKHTFIAVGDGVTAVPYGASFKVGDGGLADLLPEVVTLAPRESTEPMTVIGLQDGGVLPLSSLQGTLVSETTGQPLRGSLSIVGLEAQVTYGVGPDGKFGIPKLLPGRYNLQATIFDYFTVNESLTVGDGSTTIELRARRAY